MSYKSRAETERERWFVWREAVDYIVRADRCSIGAAQCQLRKAIEDGAFRFYGLKWADAPPERAGIANATGGAWRGRPALSSWREVMFGEDGRIINAPEMSARLGPFWYGPLYILRELVQAIWPMQRTRPAPASIQGEIEDWLRSELPKDPAKLRTKAEFKAEAQRRWPGQIKRTFDRAWSEVAKDFPDMSKAGRKPGPHRA
jgi:hypothetical protein